MNQSVNDLLIQVVVLPSKFKLLCSFNMPSRQLYFLASSFDPIYHIQFLLFATAVSLGGGRSTILLYFHFRPAPFTVICNWTILLTFTTYLSKNINIVSILYAQSLFSYGSGILNKHVMFNSRMFFLWFIRDQELIQIKEK